MFVRLLFCNQNIQTPITYIVADTPPLITSLVEGGTGVCGIAALDNFSCGILVILISKCGIALFPEPAGCGFLEFRKVLKIILLILQLFPSLYQFLIGHS